MSAVQSIIKPLAPKVPGWRQCPDPPSRFTLGYECHAWFNEAHQLAVLSAVEVATDADRIDRGPEYHVSISKRHRGSGKRCTSEEARMVLTQFGLEGAEEDNHVPSGVVRNFWRTVAEPLIGLECACKADEASIVENKGDFVWRP